MLSGTNKQVHQLMHINIYIKMQAATIKIILCVYILCVCVCVCVCVCLCVCVCVCVCVALITPISEVRKAPCWHYC